MSDFGQKGECIECGRDIGLVSGNVRYHKDDDGEPCPGRNQPPKDPNNPEARQLAIRFT